ncbi:MAG: GAF domain-containing protein [Acidobacteria bacterium]|nr:GAF domain-containing protein [Acidobacteriota bacterium]
MALQRLTDDSDRNLFQHISGIVSSELSVEEMLGQVIALAVRVTRCDACLLYLLDRHSGEIVLKASQLPHAGQLGTLRMHLGEGITGWVAEHNSIVALPANAASDSRFKRFQALVEDSYEAFLSVPLVSGGEVIGVINVHHREQHAHSAEEVGLVKFIGEQMGNAIARSLLAAQNARLLEETEEMKRQLEARKLVERAKGILQRKLNIAEEDAYIRLRDESRRLRRPMRELAEAIILAEDLSRRASEPAAAQS